MLVASILGEDNFSIHHADLDGGEDPIDVTAQFLCKSLCIQDEHGKFYAGHFICKEVDAPPVEKPHCFDGPTHG
jgi:hypothetical protein